ncbi:SRPBCC family protein [Nocardia seriolae]|uniref:SRPBCC family protein n=2 Tax=Nocardia seriolae TaxID=37332 RepID=A0ABC9YZU2_9NOCA|nr:hypothetical protein NSERKGN1266_50110 [Nocardia seriolae]BEK95483.1 hypothetical protein NSER024013_33890 [Nocardia seriolae]GAP30488.1 hypothetical protein NSK11_contig00081-0037 [Nocardia seriolae]GEM26190.1 hypothetical protein NS2_44290 [Nocardia seriolae NBRC 15557]
MRPMTSTAIGLASAVTGLAVGYRLFARKLCINWGATAEEAAKGMAGDGLLADPDFLTTRAVTINATPDRIRPWLIQIGPGRGGAYTYDWIENLLGLDIHSADEILPQFQNLAVDDVLPLGDSGPQRRVAVLERPTAFVLASTDHHWVWSFELHETATDTRLLSRNRITLPEPTLPQRLLYTYIMEPGSLIMESKMLLGIKQRAERIRALPAPASAVPMALPAHDADLDAPTRTLGV